MFEGRLRRILVVMGILVLVLLLFVSRSPKPHSQEKDSPEGGACTIELKDQAFESQFE